MSVISYNSILKFHTNVDSQSKLTKVDNIEEMISGVHGDAVAKIGSTSSGGVNQLGGHYVNGRPLNQR